MKEVKVLAATGLLGTGFLDDSFQRAIQLNPDVIGCDAGSTDPGPYYLGAGIPMSSREAVKRDLRIMISEGIKNGIPVLVGSAGTAGGKPHVDWTVDIVQEIARDENLHFKLAVIQSEIEKETLIEYMNQGRVKELYPAPEMTEEKIRSLERIVGLIGPEPYIEALQEGAQVVIAGRSSDISIYTAVPIMNGLGQGPAWHAAKVLECGTGSVEQRLYPDCMMAWITEDSFLVEPPNPQMRCTPVSVVSHTLYENSNPFKLVEPSGVLDTTMSTYYEEGDRGVRVKNSQFHHSDTYTIRIEGVEKAGYRQIAVGGIRDPIVLKQLDSFLDEVKESIQKKVKVSLQIEPSDYQLHFRVYGKSGSMGALEPIRHLEGHEAGVVMEVLAQTEEQAHSIMAIVWHTALHHPVKEWSGLASQIAFPYSPPNISLGVFYRFSLNHVIELKDPLELVSISYLMM
ncbi:MAG TPA: acyclic terpene utilization AtuA family protein [Bacillales bacterium]|nr:acyclic terpene utilization AtuA family protein [Bacillales bacterium]